MEDPTFDQLRARRDQLTSSAKPFAGFVRSPGSPKRATETDLLGTGAPASWDEARFM